MKKALKIFLLISLVLPLFNALSVNAATIVTGSTTGQTELRTGPGTNYDSVVSLPLGYSLNLVSSAIVNSENGCTAGWYKVTYSNSDAYVCSSNINLASTSAKYFTSPTWEARTHSNSLSVRSAANSASKYYVTSLNFGTDLKILSEVAAGNGCSAKWYKVRYHNNKTGYVCSTYVYKYANITATDATYGETLKVAGFPDGYIPYLTYLHHKHPTWVFTPIKTNINYKSVISGEEGKNYIQSKLSSYRTSSTAVEGSSWFKATTGVIGYYLDPRNFLNEKTIFMFENLSFDAEHQTANTIKSVFGSGTFSGDEYVNGFLAAAQEFNISPIHLASRVKQEVGIDGGKATSGEEFTWEGKTYSGYYNFYNIGAYGDNPLLRGLAYAAGLLDNTSYGVPWNSIAKGIRGGAMFLSNSYISKGQYTLYFQKFNVSPNSSYSKYTHQYMTNVNAPTAESISTYGSYKDINIMDTGFVFSIPIYNNMPEDAVTLPPVGDTNNSLTDIKIDNNLLDNFDSDVIEYNYQVLESINEVDISAAAEASTSTIEGIGKITLSEKITTIPISVISEAGTTQTYFVTIEKISDQQITTDMIIENGDLKLTNEYVSYVSPGITATNLINQIKSKSPSAIFTITNTSGINKTTEIVATGDKIKVTKLDGTSKEYLIAVKGDTSGDGKITVLDLLQVQKHILGSSNLSNARFNAADNNYDGKITVLDLLRVQKHILKALKLR